MPLCVPLIYVLLVGATRTAGQIFAGPLPPPVRILRAGAATAAGCILHPVHPRPPSRDRGARSPPGAAQRRDHFWRSPRYAALWCDSLAYFACTAI